MGYLDENGLARYDGLIKNWTTFKSGTVDGIDSLLNWQKTSTAGAVTFYPLPATPIDPVVNFLFTETGPAEGTKGPDNPSTITGVSSVKVTRCGKNLCPLLVPGSRNGITCTDNGDGTFTLSGIATSAVGFSIPAMFVLPPGTYTLSGCPAGGSTGTYYLAGLGGRYGTGSGKTFTSVVASNFSVWIQLASGVDFSTPVVFRPQLELGSTATSFEPYEGADYTVNLNGTYYGGSVDVSAGTMTVTFASIVIDGTTTYSNSAGVTEGTNSYRLGLYPSIARKNGAIALYSACNTLPINDGDNFIRLTNNSYKIEAQLQKSLLNLGDGESYSVVQSAFQTFFSAHPTTVVYPVSTPYTVQLTPTQIYSLSQPDPYTPRINTVYTDQVSVQVGYPKSPLATSTELTNAIISLGGNI